MNSEHTDFSSICSLWAGHNSFYCYVKKSYNMIRLWFHKSIKGKESTATHSIKSCTWFALNSVYFLLRKPVALLLLLLLYPQTVAHNKKYIHKSPARVKKTRFSVGLFAWWCRFPPACLNGAQYKICHCRTQRESMCIAHMYIK